MQLANTVENLAAHTITLYSLICLIISYSVMTLLVLFGDLDLLRLMRVPLHLLAMLLATLCKVDGYLTTALILALLMIASRITRLCLKNLDGTI